MGKTVADSLKDLHGSCERILFGFDLARLQAELQATIAKFPPNMPSASFGGWSLLSRDGSIGDGWSQGHLAFKKDDGIYKFDDEQGQRLGVTPWVSDYKVRTPLCDGYFGEVLDAIEAKGLNPRRARVTVITPGHSTALHVDGPTDAYSARLHIPIVTNEGCAFEYENEVIHMPADGNGLIVRVNRMHRARNYGSENRYHILMDIYDFQGATRFNRFDSSKERLVGWRAG